MKKSKEDKIIINTLETNQTILKKINRSKTNYMMDLHYKGQAFLDKKINEKELQAQINFFITMYGFMTYYYELEPSETLKRSRNYVLENLQSTITPDTFTFFEDVLNSVEANNNDFDYNKIETLFYNAYHNGYALAPHCNKTNIEEKYLKLFFDYQKDKQELENIIQTTGNARQLKKIAAQTKKHLLRKNRNY